MIIVIAVVVVAVVLFAARQIAQRRRIAREREIRRLEAEAEGHRSMAEGHREKADELNQAAVVLPKAMAYAASLIENPRKAIVVLITDFYEGAPQQRLLSVTHQLCESGATVLGLAALLFSMSVAAVWRRS